MASASVQSILARNARVEADKAWETSWTRRLLIAIAIYLVGVIFLVLIGITNPWQNALLPPAAFLLSTLTLPFAKQWWLKHRYRR